MNADEHELDELFLYALVPTFCIDRASAGDIITFHASNFQFDLRLCQEKKRKQAAKAEKSPPLQSYAEICAKPVLDCFSSVIRRTFVFVNW
jgi:hypothetical protein